MAGGGMQSSSSQRMLLQQWKMVRRSGDPEQFSPPRYILQQLNVASAAANGMHGNHEHRGLARPDRRIACVGIFRTRWTGHNGIWNGRTDNRLYWTTGR